MNDSLGRPMLAELIGTFALVFIGAGTAALVGSAGFPGVVSVAFAHGLVLLAFAYAYGHISGTHINPAVTIGVWAAGKMPAGRAGAYIVSQLVGGALAGYGLFFVLGGADTGLGATVLAQNLQVGDASVTVTPAAGFFLEALLTFFLVNTVMNAGISGKATSMAGMAIGLTLTFCILLGGPLTGASLNPSRTLGPALASGNYADFWLYMVAPPVGGLVAALLYRGGFEPK